MQCGVRRFDTAFLSQSVGPEEAASSRRTPKADPRCRRFTLRWGTSIAGRDCLFVVNKMLLAALLIFSLGQMARADDPSESYADAHARASLLDGTPESKVYAPIFSRAVASVIIDAIRGCLANSKLPDAVNFVVILDTDGSVRRTIPEPGQAVTACVADKLAGTKFPPPPRSNWPVFVTVAIK